MGLSRRQLPSPLGGSGAGDGLAETKPSRPRAEMPMKLPKRAERTERSMRSLQRRGCEDELAAQLEVERGNWESLRGEVEILSGNDRRDFLWAVPKLPTTSHTLVESIKNKKNSN